MNRQLLTLSDTILPMIIPNASPKELIQKRISIRSFQPQNLSPQIIQGITNFAAKVPHLFETQLRVEVLHIPSIEKDRDLKLGTYGIIRGTNFFIAAVHPRGTLHLLNAGYILEQTILYATSLELGTCWLAGTFNRDDFGQAMHLSENETLPAIIAVGYPHGQSFNLMDTIFRTMARSRTRKAWDQLFFDQNFNQPLSPERAGAYAGVFEMVRLAPSASNKQPWRLLQLGRDVHFFIQRAPTQKKNIPFFNLPYVDLGIAMAHFELSAVEEGLAGTWQISPPEAINPLPGMTYVATWKGIS